MSRIRKGYEARFRALLQQAGARRLDQGVEWLVQKAERLRRETRMPLADELSRICDDLATKTANRKHGSKQPVTLFWCDAGLGGLARWLRAAGYDTLWRADIDDDELLREARTVSATVLTTDAMLMERRLLRDRVIRAFWLSPTLGIPEQLELVFREYGLTVGAPRCMSCGGELRRKDKEALRERIPPRTYRWLDEYFVCDRCDKLFWHGTHWRRIVKALNALKR